jgi:soluble lytic murein transglycosylase-like protein
MTHPDSVSDGRPRTMLADARAALLHLLAIVAAVAAILAAWTIARSHPLDDAFPGDRRAPAADSGAAATSSAVHLPRLRFLEQVAVLPTVTTVAARPAVLTGAAADSAHAASVARVLRRYNRDRALTSRIAHAVIREARRSRVDAALVVAVLVAENNLLKPWARNRSTNAQGLMQVMPRWAGRLGCPSTDLTDVDANICHGVRVLAVHLREAKGDPREGLRRRWCWRTPRACSARSRRTAGRRGRPRRPARPAHADGPHRTTARPRPAAGVGLSSGAR